MLLIEIHTETMTDSDEEELSEKQFKICLIGDSTVGKTSIVRHVQMLRSIFSRPASGPLDGSYSLN